MANRQLIIYGTLTLLALVRIVSSCNLSTQKCTTEAAVASNFLRTQKSDLEHKIFALLPSPHAELLVGMTIGDDLFKNVPIFKQKLKDTGTIHVVVVSGFNISLVFGLVIKMLGSAYLKRNLLFAFCITFFYALISGFEPPVIRAWIMGSLIALGKYYGRKLPIVQVLVFSGLVLVLFNPSYFFSFSFQLSFLATLSLILFSEPISGALGGAKNLLLTDLSSTLAAQILVWPYISYQFKTVSLVSPLVNMLVLWTVPLATVIGGLFIFAVIVSQSLSVLIAPIIFLPLDYFVTLIDMFSKLEFASIDFTIRLPVLVFYYIVIGFVYFKKWRL